MHSQVYIKNMNLHTKKIKNLILKYLNKNINTEYKIFRIEKDGDLDDIKKGQYLVCPRYEGVRSWIVFIKIDKVYYAVNFPKYNKIKNMELNIYPIDFPVSSKLYYGTIMEGIYFKKEDIRYLIIDEVYLLEGQPQLLKPKDDRLTYLTQYLASHITRITKFQMYVSKFYLLERNHLEDLYERIKSNNNICELIFYPKNYEKKNLLLYYRRYRCTR